MSKVLEMSKTSFRLCHWTKSSFFAQGDWFQNNSEHKQWDHWCPRRHEYQPEVWCLTWWNTSVSHNESECLCFNSHCTNLPIHSTGREKKSNFWLPFLTSGTSKFSLLTGKFPNNVQRWWKLRQIRAGFYLFNIFYSFCLVLLVSYLYIYHIV